MLYTIVSVYPLGGRIVLTLAANCPRANCLDTAANKHTFTRTSRTRLGRFVFHHQVLESVRKRYRNVWHRGRTVAKKYLCRKQPFQCRCVASSTIRTRGNYLNAVLGPFTVFSRSALTKKDKHSGNALNCISIASYPCEPTQKSSKTENRGMKTHSIGCLAPERKKTLKCY